MKMTNEIMAAYIELLSGLQEKGKLGYAIARNTRLLKEAATEYLQTRAKVFQDFGETDKVTGMTTIKVDVLNRELDGIQKLEHEVDIYQIDEETFISGNLTSNQMEQLMWMVKSPEKPKDAKKKVED